MRAADAEMMDRDLSLRDLVLVAAAVYSVWTPIYFLAKPEPVTPPDGARVELILPTSSMNEAGQLVRRFGFKQRANENESTRPFVVYEDTTQLPPDHYELAPFNAKNRWREVEFRSSDGSDPRYNGRRYYVVLPQ